MCPRCHAVRNMVITVSTSVTRGVDGMLSKSRDRLFHCETCNAFVRSEHSEPQGGTHFP